MSRDLSTALKNALQADAVNPIFLVAAYFDGGTTRLWSGLGDLSWNSQTWLGTGSLIQIDTLEEPQEIKANGTKVTLSGIPSANIALALDEPYQGRPLEIYLGAMDSSNTVIVDPVQMFSGFMDIMSITEGSETASITMTVENRLIDLERARISRYTSGDQNILYPADKGFDFVPDLQDKRIKWGGG